MRTAVLAGGFAAVLAITGASMAAADHDPSPGREASHPPGAASSTDSAQAVRPPSARAEVTPLSDEVSMYPRGVRLEHQADADVNGRLVASVTTFTNRGGEGQIFESRDDGRGFEQIALIPLSEHNGQQGLCCGSLFELPRSVGALPAGTLLYSASVGQDEPDRRMDLDIWASQDGGHSWSYLSTCASAPDTGGRWEPELSLALDGRLVCHYAEEEPSTGDDDVPPQRLVRRTSTDGVNWSERTVTVDAIGGGERPGMPVVRALPDGSYVMVFEVCGAPGQYDCAVYSRTSPDGLDWGEPGEHGEIITSVHDRYFRHAPTVTWADDGSGDGVLMVIGQLLRDADGEEADGNGQTIFVRRHANAEWTETAAPVPVPDASSHFCPNYSSSLVPLQDGRTFVELASDIADDGECKTSFARGHLGGRADDPGPR